MQKFKFTVLFSVIILIVLSSCNKDSKLTSMDTNAIDADKIYQYLILDYDASANETKIFAYLCKENQNGKSLLLGEGSTIKVNDFLMTESGNHYYKIFNGMIDSAVIVFSDSRGGEYANTIFNGAFISNDNTNVLSKTINSSWYFGGNTIQTNETVNLTFKMKSNTSLDASISSSLLGSNFLNIDTTSLNDLTQGIAIAQTKRSSYKYSGKWTSVGGTLKSVFKSNTSEINILP